MYNSSTETWTFLRGSASDSSIPIVDTQTGTVSNATIQIMSPFLAEKTTVLSQAMAYTASQWNMTAGAHTGATSFTAFTLASSTAATLTGTVRIYGYANS